jgi:hypothetical protein
VGIRIEAAQEFDSDADSDPDADACGKGSRMGSSPFLPVSARHAAYGEPTQDRDEFQ